MWFNNSSCSISSNSPVNKSELNFNLLFADVVKGISDSTSSSPINNSSMRSSSSLRGIRLVWTCRQSVWHYYGTNRYRRILLWLARTKLIFAKKETEIFSYYNTNFNKILFYKKYKVSET